MSAIPRVTTSGDPFKDNIVLSCPVLYFHFFWGICMIFLSWVTISSRFIDRILPYHRTLGKTWIYGMIIQLYTSSYIHRDGFRWFIFMFGLICYGGIILGHYFISKYLLAKSDRLKGSLLAADGLNMDSTAPRVVDDVPEQQKVTAPTAMPSLNQMQVWRTLHATFMIIASIMVFGAGAAFTIRWSKVNQCTNLYSPM